MTLAELNEWLSYCPDTGVFRWLKKPSRKIAIGSVAGGIKGHGYRSIMFNGANYQEHRLAWLAMTGKPPTKHIDHRNRERADNRWCNLREATQSENLQNQASVGVAPSRNGWVAYVNVSGKQIQKWFADRSLAVAWRNAEVSKHYPFREVQS